jgi:hypothetical protein
MALSATTKRSGHPGSSPSAATKTVGAQKQPGQVRTRTVLLDNIKSDPVDSAAVGPLTTPPQDPSAPSLPELAALAWAGRPKHIDTAKPQATDTATAEPATAVPATATDTAATVQAAAATSTTGLVMGGSGQPLPNFNYPGYVELANELYIHRHFPDTTYPAPYADGLFTPEYPVGGLPFYLNYPAATSGVLAGFPALFTSMGQGMLILENAIKTNIANGVSSTVFGYSQSSVISGLVMQHLVATGVNVPDGFLQFVLIGDTAAPNGGLAERFVGLDLPSVGMSFDGATPSDLFPTAMYTIEYDGLGGGFPRYPINFLADLNAAMGYLFRHGLFMTLTSDEVDQAIVLPGSKSLGADNLTDYYMITSSMLPGTNSYLPLLQPLLSIPLIGKPLADLLQPDLTVLINLGYGPDNVGYSTPANVPTPFGLFPNVSLATVVNELVAGAQEGVNAFVADIGDELHSFSLPSFSPASSTSSAPSLTSLAAAMSAAAVDPAGTLAKAAGSIASSIAAEITHVTEALTNTAVALYNPLLPTAGVINAIITTLPAYNVSLFLNNLSNPVNAIGLPIAADVGLVTLMVALDAQIWLNGIVGAANWFFTIFTLPPS